MGMTFLVVCTYLGSCASDRDSSPEDELAQRLRGHAEELQTPRGRGLPDTSNLHDLAQAETDRKAAIEQARERLLTMEREVKEVPNDPEARTAWVATYQPKDPERATQVECFLYGCALDLNGERSRARFELERAARDTDFQPAVLALGKWFYREKDYQTAQLHLLRALRLDGHDWDARLTLADVYQRTRRDQEAETIAREGLICEDATHGEERLQVGWWLAGFLAQRGRHGEVPAVLAPLEQEFDGQAELHLRLANAYVAMGEAEKAVHHFDRAVAIGQTGWEQLLEYARALRIAGDPTKSFEVYAKILQEAPEAFFERVPKMVLLESMRLAREEMDAGTRIHFDLDELLSIARNETKLVDQRVDACALLIDRLDVLPAAIVFELVDAFIHSEHVELQDYGVRFLGRGLPEEGVSILQQIAVDPRRAEKVRVAACVALRQMQRPTSRIAACETLLQCLSDSSTEIFHASQQSLERLTGMVATTWSREELDQEPGERKRVADRWKRHLEKFRKQVEREAH